MKAKGFTKISARILLTFLAVTMVFLTLASSLGVQVSAGGPAIIKNDSILSSYEQFLNNKVVLKLPDTIESEDVISVIVKLDSPSLMEAYQSTDRSIPFDEYILSEDAEAVKANIAAAKDDYLAKLKEEGVVFETGADYANVLAGFELLYKAKYFETACDSLAKGAVAIVGEEYTPANSQYVENEVSFYEDTGIFDSSSFGYDGEGMVIAVLDTGLDYTHPAFSDDEKYFTSKNLGLTYAQVAKRLSSTKAYMQFAGLTADDVYVNNKVPFSFDYADNDPDVYSLHNNHGTHVSGVVLGNDDVITGVAPNAQLVSMKIFSDTQDTARASWILSALDDCVALGVDVINMSLGTACGFARPVDEEAISGVYDDIRDLGISLVVAASNSFSSAYGSEKNGNLGLTSNPDTSTVGSPSTYGPSLSVASIDGKKTPYMLYNDRIIYFVESSDSSGEEKSFFDEILDDGVDEVDMPYVLIPGIGNLSDYEGIDVAGKIVLVRRGTNTFEEKAKAAKKAGAAAIIIYNNTSGDIKMNSGIVDIPVCSISQDDGEFLASAKTGTLKISSKQTSGPFISDFSSWGPTPSLNIKPEITAHGGNILSAVTGHGYDRLSGTSMACPNMAGAVAIMRQYVIEELGSLVTDEHGNVDNVKVNAVVNRLFMSTADIMINKNGLPYAVRKQGAGLANLSDSAATKAYILTYDRLDGSVMDKSKIELGDDPQRTGIYTLQFTIDNFGNSALSYDISATVMTEGVSDTPTYSGETVVTGEGYLLNGALVKVISATGGGTASGNTVTVNGNSKCDVTVTITLSDEDKEYLNSSFENGMYVEGFVTLTAKEEASEDLNVPYLAFYGNWFDAPIFDIDYYETNADELNDALALLDKNLPDAYATRPIGGISEDYINYLGSYYFIQNPQNKIISASRDYIALSNTDGTVHSLRFVWAGMLRNAGKIAITITDDATGEIVFEKIEENVRKSYSDGGSYVYPANVEIEFDVAEEDLKNNSTYSVKLVGYVDYGDGGTEVNKNCVFEFPFTVDFEAPAVTDCNFYTEYDKELKKNRLYAELAVYDNHYAMGMQIGYVGSGQTVDESTGETVSANMLYPFESYITPIYSVKNGTTYVTYELTDHISKIKANAVNKNTFALSIYDYALNEATYEIELPDDFLDLCIDTDKLTYVETDDIAIANGDGSYSPLALNDFVLYLNPNEVYNLSALVYPETEWYELLSYTDIPGNDTLSIVNDKIIAKKSGYEYVTIIGTHAETGDPIETKLHVIVRNEEHKGYRELSRPVADVFRIDGYYTEKAFYILDNTERDIGETGETTVYPTEHYSLSLYPSESVRLNWTLDAYFPEITAYRFTSGNEAIVKVDDNGVVTAMGEGFTSINMTVLQDGKPTLSSKTISIEVKDPYVRNGPTLTSYYGAGEFNSGVVNISKDLLFTQIGQYAFSNYNYIPKDLEAGDVIDDDNPDFTKIMFIGNDDITEITLPEGIESIGPYAFAGLTSLKTVHLPSTLETIEYGAFFGCSSLTKVTGLEHVKLINSEAFFGCDISNDLSFDSIHAIGPYAFAYNTHLKKVSFAETLSSIGASAFEGDKALSSFVTAEGDNVKYGSYVFNGCTSLTSIKINTNVIPAGAFYGTTALKDITIGKDVASIGEYAFSESGLTTFNVSPENSVYKVSADKTYLTSKDGATLLLHAPTPKDGSLLKLMGSIILPETITTIGYSAFAGNDHLKSITMKGVTKVMDYAFSECKRLENAVVGSTGLELIGNYAFFLTDIETLPTFAASLKTIGNYAFSFTNIIDISIKDGMTIGEGAFCECPYLEWVRIGNNVTIGDSAFLHGANTLNPDDDSKFHNMTIKYDEAGKYYYQKYSAPLVKLDIGNNAIIGDSAFFGCVSLTDVTLGAGAVIGDMSFYSCASLEAIDLSQVKSIGKLAFSGDNVYCFKNGNLSNLTLSDPLVEMVNGELVYKVLYYSPKLVNVDLSSAEYIGESAFIFCKNLETVTLGDGITHIPDEAFSNCSKLASINLDGIVTIGYAAFSETALTSVDLSAATDIGDYAFTYCRDLETVKLARIEITVGEGAFSECGKLTTVENMGYVVSFGDYAFAHTDLTGADLTSAVTVGDFAFMKKEPSANVFALVLGKNVESLGDNPFAMCKLAPLYVERDIYFNEKPVGKEYLYTFDVSASVKVINGSIYCKVPYGLELTTYVGLDRNGDSLDRENVILDPDTVRITAMAFIGADIERITLPHAMNAIGHKAFFGCEKLRIVVFESYEAPVLEEAFDQKLYENFLNIPFTSDEPIEFTYTYDLDGDGDEYVGVEETKNSKGEYTQFVRKVEPLAIIPFYMYNIESSKFSNIYYGANFVNYIGYTYLPGVEYRSYENMGELIMVSPSNGEFYDSFIYSQYFDSIIKGDIAANDFTVAAINAIKALPDSITLKDEHLVIAAREAYNKIGSADQQALVSEYYQKLLNAENFIKVLKGDGESNETVTPAPVDDGISADRIAVIILSIIEGLEITALAVLVIIYFYKKKKKNAEGLIQESIQPRTFSVKNPNAGIAQAKVAEAESEGEDDGKAEDASESDNNASKDETNVEQTMSRNEKFKKIKSITLSGVLLVLCLGAVIFAATKCSKDTSPYDDFASAGYNVSVKYDANGGVFTTNTYTIIDTYNIDKLPSVRDGVKSLALIDPADSIRGTQAYTAAKVGYYLAGWYTERTEVKDANGNVVSYTYGGRWDFGGDTLELSADKDYSIETPVITLYAAWVPALSYEFYSVDEDGNVALIGVKDLNPLSNTTITLPAFNEQTGGTDANDFPELSSSTYDAIYFDEGCTEKINTATITHTGSYDEESATVTGETVKIYCKLLDGLHFTIESAEQLVKNAYANGVYTLTDDLDFEGLLWPEVFTRSDFTGSIIGNGHSIENVTLEQTNNDTVYYGLFAKLAAGALIEDVRFENVTVNVKAGSFANESDDARFGIIAGVSADNTMSNVTLSHAKMVIYTDLIASQTIIAPEYGLITAEGSVDGVTADNLSVEFSDFGSSSQQIVYVMTDIGDMRFTLAVSD